jgi:hypothetical protein
MAKIGLLAQDFACRRTEKIRGPLRAQKTGFPQPKYK